MESNREEGPDFECFSYAPCFRQHMRVLYISLDNALDLISERFILLLFRLVTAIHEKHD